MDAALLILFIFEDSLPGTEVFLGLAALGLFLVAWAKNIWERWRLAAGLISFAYAILGGAGLVAWENPSSWPVTATGKYFLIVMVVAGVAGAVLFFPAWYEEESRPLPAPKVGSREETADRAPVGPGHQLPR